MSAVEELAARIGTAPACAALGMPRASLYRHRNPAEARERPPRPTPERALSARDQQAVLEELHSARFVDKAPAEVYATLLDEGTYLCSVRTMYRLLAANQEVRERRNQLRHPSYTKPELLAERRNQVWSWDITKLRGPGGWNYFHLYVVMDIYSRYIVGWMVAECESAELAEQLIAETCAKQDVQRGQLTVHADNGSSMKSKSVALLLTDLGVAKSHSRPHVSDDNPYSEAQFKTLKYRPDFPERFGSVEDARTFCREFVRWYNDEHHHGGIGLLTPADVHHGRAQQMHAARQVTLTVAYAQHPERFVQRPPQPPPLPTAAWINPPKPSPATERLEDRRAGERPQGPGGVAPRYT